MTTEFVYNEHSMGGRRIACTLVPNEIYLMANVFEKRYMLHVNPDEGRLESDLTKPMLKNVSCEAVRIDDIFPHETQTQKDWLKGKSNNSITSVDNLDRFETIVNTVTETGSISPEVFYGLMDFVQYECTYLYLTSDERTFIQSLNDSQLGSQPTTTAAEGHIIRMTRRIFDKLTPSDTKYNIENYRRFADFYGESWPIVLNLTNLKFNVDYIGV